MALGHQEKASAPPGSQTARGETFIQRVRPSGCGFDNPCGCRGKRSGNEGRPSPPIKSIYSVVVLARAARVC